MKLMVSGHREEKLSTCDREAIRSLMGRLVGSLMFQHGYSVALSGMASGVDLWFMEDCLKWGYRCVACVPFENQTDYMTAEAAEWREGLLRRAHETLHVRNRYMTQNCDAAVVVWDGNKGGTHNCFQQLLEYKKKIFWIAPQYPSVVEVPSVPAWLV